MRTKSTDPGVRRTIRNVCADISWGSRYPLRGSITQWAKRLAIWPPNVFALTSVLLSDSGAYRLAVSPPEGERWPNRKRWNDRVIQEGKAWLRTASAGKPPPPAILEKVEMLAGSCDVELYNLCGRAHWELCSALLELHAAADEAAAGVGLPLPDEVSPEEFWFLMKANERLTRVGTLAELAVDAVRVLPKLRTPQTGISLRSLSHNLAVHQNEVDVHWRVQEGLAAGQQHKLNLLLLPWPMEISPRAFKPSEGRLINMNRKKFGFFSFDHDEKIDPDKLGKIIDKAKQRVGDVHGLVMPESAIREVEVKCVQDVLAERNVPLLVTGVRAEHVNKAHLSILYRGEWRSTSQNKHHRWCLDEGQIRAYSLGSSLDPGLRWWEDMDVGKRELHFVTTSEWLTLCHLVCEDLARQDPVAHVVRAVGPTLVIALLLDGPQLSARWSARYAGVLADDPGSSVLTVTSLGMAQRSRPRDRAPSRVIALWKDPRQGEREISLEKEASAVVLMLCADIDVEEWSADGRSDHGVSSHLTFGGLEQIIV